MGRGIVSPEGAAVAGLPAFDGLGCGLVAGVGRESVCDGPAADAGAVSLEMGDPFLTCFTCPLFP